MATASTSLMTADEFYDFVHRPENRDRHFELEEGEVVEVPPPSHLYGVVCAFITALLVNYCRQVKVGRVTCHDAGLILDRNPDTVRGPDVVFYPNDKKYEDLSRKYSETIPTLVVEVLAPSNRATTVIRRLNHFLDSGVSVVWMVEPESKSVTMWWPGQEPIVREEKEEIADLPGLPGFRCRVAELFSL